MPGVDSQKRGGPYETAITTMKPFRTTLEGKLVSIIGNQLVMTNEEGKEHSHTLAEDVKLSLEGATCRAEDLQAGNKIRLIRRRKNQKAATGSESPQSKATILKIN